MRLNGIDADSSTATRCASCAPISTFPTRRASRSTARIFQGRAGTARHDAVAWGYARAADGHGVDIIQNCEVTGFIRDGERIVGVETTSGTIGAGKVGLAVAGHTSVLGAKAGLRTADRKPRPAGLRHRAAEAAGRPRRRLRRGPFLRQPVRQGRAGLRRQSRRLQFLCPARQSRRRARGGGSGVALMPCISRVRLLRHWGGVMDMTPDGSPIICPTPIAGPLSQRRLVLRRLQGDAGLRLVLRPHHRQRQAAPAERRLHARPLPHRPHARRGRRRPAAWLQ